MDATWTERVQRWTERVEASTRHGTHRWVTAMAKEGMVGSDQHVWITVTPSSKARWEHVTAPNLTDVTAQELGC